MITYFKSRSKSLPYRVLSAFVAFTFSFSYIVPPSSLYAQGLPAAVMNLPVPGTPVPLTPGFTPARIIGMTIHEDNPLMFDFMVDPGDTKLNDRKMQDESLKLVKYFLASLTVPAEKLWVNLSPYEKDKIVPVEFGQTEMGAELLAQDYMLKQLTASLMNPEDELGKKFWDRVYEKAQKLFGTTEIPLNTFNKVWIVPEKAVVYNNGLNVFILESHLKVMMEEDYLALRHHSAESPDAKSDVVSGVSSSVIKEVLLPEIEKEVNEGKTFANLRQIHHSLILAAWYKQNLKESLLGQIYADKAKTGGLTVKDTETGQKIYEQYVAAFQKGVYNFIKEDYDPATKQIIPRKYFSGGVNEAKLEIEDKTLPDPKVLKTFADTAADASLITAGVKSPGEEISFNMPFPKTTPAASPLSAERREMVRKYLAALPTPFLSSERVLSDPDLIWQIDKYTQNNDVFQGILNVLLDVQKAITQGEMRLTQEVAALFPLIFRNLPVNAFAIIRELALLDLAVVATKDQDTISHSLELYRWVIKNELPAEIPGTFDLIRSFVRLRKHLSSSEIETLKREILGDNPSASSPVSVSEWIEKTLAGEENIEVPAVLAAAERQKREYVIGGNWKMAVETEDKAVELIRAITQKLNDAVTAKGLAPEGLDIVIAVAPSFVHLPAVRRELKRLEDNGELLKGLIALGAQDVSAYDPGARTSEISAKQLADLGIRYVIIGHSERRRGDVRETSRIVNAKVKKALEQGLIPIIAVGETLEEREAGRTYDVLMTQFLESTADLTAEQMKNVIIAYEPVWAIGTGKTATPQEADKAQRFLRAVALNRYGPAAAGALRIQYGGSMNAANVGSLIQQYNIDGGLIGGAALKPDDFVRIVTASLDHFKASLPAAELEKLARRLGVAPQEVDGVIEEYVQAMGEIVNRIPFLSYSGGIEAIDLFTDLEDVIISLIYKREYTSKEKIDELRIDAEEGDSLSVLGGVGHVADFFREEKGFERLYGKGVAEDLRGDFRLLRELLGTGLIGFTLTPEQISDKTAIRNVIKDTILAASSPVVATKQEVSTWGGFDGLKIGETIKITVKPSGKNLKKRVPVAEVGHIKQTAPSLSWYRLKQELTNDVYIVELKSGTGKNNLLFNIGSDTDGLSWISVFRSNDGENYEFVSKNDNKSQAINVTEAMKTLTFRVFEGEKRIEVVVSKRWFDLLKGIQERKLIADTGLETLSGYRFDFKLASSPASSSVSEERVQTAARLVGMEVTSDKGPATKGGIDLNPGNMDLRTNDGGERIRLPMPDMPLENIKIDGLLPIIIRVAPVANLPLLLGLADQPEPDDAAGFRPQPPPADAPRRFKAREVEEVGLLN